MTKRSPSAEHLLVVRISAQLAAQLGACPVQTMPAPEPPVGPTSIQSVPDAHRRVQMGAAAEYLRQLRAQPEVYLVEATATVERAVRSWCTFGLWGERSSVRKIPNV